MISLNAFLDKFGGITISLLVLSIFYIIYWSFRSFIVGFISFFDNYLNLSMSIVFGLLILPFSLFVFHFFMVSGVFIDRQISNGPLHINKSLLSIKIMWGEKEISLTFFFLISYLLGVLFVVLGYSMNYSANILWFSGLNHGLHQTHPAFMNQIWLFDEILGHWFLFTGIFLLAVNLGVFNLQHPSRRTISWKIHFLLIAVILFVSILWVLFIVEGDFGWTGTIFSLILIIFYLYKIKSRLHRNSSFTNPIKLNRFDLLRTSLNQFPNVWYQFCFFATTFFGLIFYFWLFKGFVQPSEFNFWCQLKFFLC